MLALVAKDSCPFLTRPSLHRLVSRFKSFSGLIGDNDKVDFSTRPKKGKKSRLCVKPMDYESLPRIVNTKRSPSDLMFIQARKKKKEFNGDLPKNVYFQVSF